MGHPENQRARRHLAVSVLEWYRATPLTTVGLFAALSLTFYLRLLSYGQYIEGDVGNLSYLAWRLSEGEVLLDLEGPGKPPLYFMLYAVFLSLFSPSLLGLKLFGTLFVLLAVVAIYWLTSQAYGKRIGLLAAFLFGVFSSGPRVEGGTVNMETMLHLPTILAIGAFLKAATIGHLRWFFLAGLCAALASLFKQVGGILFFVFLCFGLAEWWRNRARGVGRRFLCASLMVVLGALIPVLLVVGFYRFHGFTLAQIYDTMIGSNFHYIQKGYELANVRKAFLVRMSWILPENALLWLGVAAAGAHLFWRSKQGDIRTADRLLLWWAIWSFAVLWVSGRFYPHYFLQIIAPFSALAAYGIVAVWNWSVRLSSLTRASARAAWALALALTVAVFVNTDYEYFFTYAPDEQTAFQHGGDVIVQRVIAQYVRSQTISEDTIYVWGIAPQIYFEAQRKAATRYRNNFDMSRNVTDRAPEVLRIYAPLVMEDLLKSPPAYIVQLDYQGYTLEVFPELQRFVQAHYQLDEEAGTYLAALGIRLFQRLSEPRIAPVALHHEAKP
jgi:hypothetical protein